MPARARAHQRRTHPRGASHCGPPNPLSACARLGFVAIAAPAQPGKGSSMTSHISDGSTLTRPAAFDSDSSASCQRPAAASQHDPAGAANTRHDSAKQRRAPMSEPTASGYRLAAGLVLTAFAILGPAARAAADGSARRPPPIPTPPAERGHLLVRLTHRRDHSVQPRPMRCARGP